MIRATLDANVLISGTTGFAISASVPGELLRRWRTGDFELVVSEHIIEEVTRALGEPYFRRRLSDEQIVRIGRLLRRQARVVEITERFPSTATHEEDDLVLATAASGDVDYLVTGDRQLQRLGSFRTIPIISPRAFLGVLETREDD